MTAFEIFMPGWGWVIFSLIAAVFSGAIYLVNQYLRQPGDFLVFWMRVAIVLAMAPVMHFVTWPTDARFYIAVVLTVACAVYADIRTLNVSAKYGGGVVSRVQPLLVWGAFFLWFLFDPGLLWEYAARPFNTGIILLSLAGCVYFGSHQNKCHISRKALIEMLPALAGYSVTAVFNKYAMAHGTVAGAALGYMFVQSALAIPLLGLHLMWRDRKIKIPAVWRTRNMMIAALLAAAAWLAHMVFKNYAMAFTPNPSYQAAINLTAPLFIALFYMATGHKEEADVKSGMGVVACAMLLALATVR